MKKYLIKFAFAFVLGLLILNFKSSSVSAATRTWDGGGGADTNWSTCANWDGPDICPVAGDTVTFNATSTNNSTIDAGFGGSIGVINVNSGYTGTITQAETLTITSTLTVSAGTYNASNQTLTVTASTTVNGGTMNFNSSTATLDSAGGAADGLVFSSGTLTLSSATVSMKGNLTFSGSGTFSANGGTLNLIGSGTLSCNNVTFNSIIFNNSNTYTVNSDCNLPLGSNPTVAAGITLNGTLSGSGIFRINNTFTVNSGAILTGFSDMSTNIFVLSGANLNLSTYNTFSDAGTFTISSGTFTAPATMNLRGSFLHTGGTFNPNVGTVNLTQTVAINITGSTTFYNLTHTSSGNLVMAAGTTQTILGTLTLQGLTSRFTVRSSVAGTPWKIDAQGGRLLSNINISDSNNINSNPMTASNSTDGGGNTNWLFTSGPTISFYLDYPGGNSHITNTNPTYRWKKATASINSSITKYELYLQPKDTITDANTGTALYIDNIQPFIGDNKQYAYYSTYTLRDDGTFLNLTPNNYILTPGKYNFRVVAHDSAGNVREESVDFWVDGTSANSPTHTNNPISTNTKLANQSNTNQTTQPSNNETMNSTPTPEPTTAPVITPILNNNSHFPWWILIVLIILLLIFLPLFLKKKKEKKEQLP